MKDKLLIHFHEWSDHYRKIFRYLMSGGTAAALDLFLLHVFVEYFHIWYLLAAAIAYLIAFFVSFLLQKFWTFQETSKDSMHIQMVLHFTLGLVNLGINTVALYTFVDFFHLHYLFSQVIISGLIAIVSFFVYKHFIFKPKIGI